MLVLGIVGFLLFYAPFILYPQIYFIYKLIKKVRHEKLNKNINIKKIILYYLVVCLIVIATAILYAFIFIDDPPFILKLLFYIFVLPFYMVVISFFAGMGKAFEAGFSARRFLETLDSIQAEKNQPNPKMKADD
ncbi:MAG: hypothetical protein C0621_10635 [Desulfuromonas sp.]|nr:MAG: hypothetical protein C0621_10635 [Desulfuromonas sp.]